MNDNIYVSKKIQKDIIIEIKVIITKFSCCTLESINKVPFYLNKILQKIDKKILVIQLNEFDISTRLFARIGIAKSSATR